MFGFGRSTLPVTAEQQQWVDDGFVRLAAMLGTDRFFSASIMLPTEQHFPDRYDGSEEAAAVLFARVAHAMDLSPDDIAVTFFNSSEGMAQAVLPLASGKSFGVGGLYFHEVTKKARIAISADKLKDPMALVATIAHELGHVILLRPGLVDREEPDMEPLNDLLTVFLGFGVFNANAAFQFNQFTDYEKQGWSMSRLGYLSEEVFGYALARYALERGDLRPAWTAHLSRNVANYFKRSAKWLEQTGARHLLAH